MATSKRGGRRFLGEFTQETVSLSLKSLKPHQLVRVSFELVILKDWAGVATEGNPAGPEQWGLRVDGGPTLLHASFANPMYGRVGTRSQTYPTLIPGEKVAAGTRAAESGSLGYGGDSVYKIDLTFPHADAALQLCFYGEQLDDVDDASWGIDHVSVELLSSDDVPALDEPGLTMLWQELGTADPQEGYDAAWKLIAQNERGVTFCERMLAAEMSKAPHVDKFTERVRQLIAQLDADQFRTRKRAMRDLLALGTRTVPLLRQAIKSPSSAEVRWRLEQILSQLDDVDPATFTDDVRRRERLLSVLQMIGSPRATKLAERVAAGP